MKKQLKRQARKIEQARQMLVSTEPELPDHCRDRLDVALSELGKLETSVLEEIGKAPPLSRR